ncbi:MAG: PKD domain-containing protein [Saprospiraceae bacterium]
MRIKQFIFIIQLSICAVLINSCKKDEVLVPPASTVPSFTYTIDNNSVAPATVTFTNTSIVPDGVGDATYYWNFGDGSSTEEASPTHYYSTSGAYTVNLVVVTAVSLEIKESNKTIIIKDPSASGTPVYFTNGSIVYRALVNNAGPVFEQLPVSGLQDSYGMIFDTVHNKLYITDFNAGQILQSDPDGTNQIVFRSGIDGPDGLAIDYQQNQIYWDVTNGIQRADMSNSDVNQREDFVTGQANDPDGLSIDPVTRALFWNNYNGGVGRKYLDGSGESLIIPVTGGGGSIIVVDDRIYFDEYVASGDIRLRSANLDGTEIALVAAGISRVMYGLAYEPLSQRIYWGDRSPGAIMRAKLDGSDVEPFYLVAGSSPRGITFGKHF